MVGQHKKFGQEMSTDKTNAARTRQYNDKQEKHLVCDQHLEDDAPKTDEGFKH